MSTRTSRSIFSFFVTLLTLVFLYIPLVTVFVVSFNSNRFSGIWKSFSFIWYERLFQNFQIWTALVYSLLIAVVATIISTVLGTLSAMALYRSRSKIMGIYRALIYLPLVVPDILIGISMLFLYVLVMNILGPCIQSLFGIEFGFGMTTIVISHVTFCLSYVTLIVLGRLQEFDNSLLEAAADLGASGWYTFFHVTLPNIMPGIIAGALFAFTLSIDDFVITYFVKGVGDITLPVFIQGAIKKGGKVLPQLNALSVIFVLFTFLIVFVTRKFISINFQRKQQK